MKKLVTTTIAWGFLLITALAATGCATNAATGKSDLMLVSEAEETQLGREEHENFVRSQGLYSDKQLQDYVQKIGNKIVQVSDRKHIQYQFFVLNQPEVNAFALPNGNIYVTRGLLAYLNSEAELAAVLSHEVAHVAARHSAQLISSAKVASATSTVVGLLAGVAVAAATGDVSLAQSSMNLTSNISTLTSALIIGSYSREHELEADQLGSGYLSRAGYPPQAITGVLETLKNIEKFEASRATKDGKKRTLYHQAFATHPALEERIEKIDSAQGMDSTSPDIAYLTQTMGLEFETLDAPPPAQARKDLWFVRESLFQGYLPPEWKVVESSKDGIKLENAKDGIRTDIRLLPPQSDQDPQHFFSGPQVSATTVKDVKPLTHIYHKKPAFSALAELKAADNKLHAYVSVLFHEKHTVLLTGTHKDTAWLDTHRYVFDAQTNMTKLMTQAEYDQTRIKRLKVVKANAGDTYSTLAKASPLGAASEDYLRLINHQYPSGEPTAGHTIKIIVAD